MDLLQKGHAPGQAAGLVGYRTAGRYADADVNLGGVGGRHSSGGTRLFGLLKYLFGLGKLDADPAQQQLAQLIIEVLERRCNFNDVLGFLLSHGGSRSDQGDRLVHAASIVRVWRADLYSAAKLLCRDIYCML